MAIQRERDAIARRLYGKAEGDTLTQEEIDNVTNALTIRRDNALQAPPELRPVALSTSSEDGLPSIPQFEMMARIAQTVLTAGAEMVPASFKTPEAALAVMIAGFEQGFTPFSALRQVFIINGRTEFMTPGLIAIVLRNDPTAEFIWHRYDATGAEVELVRNGRTVSRVTFDERDRAASHQGEKKRVKEWKTSQNGKRYPEYHNPPQYEIDHDSYWQRWPRDAYAYNACKRAVKLGAPDCLYMRPPIVIGEGPRITVEPTAEDRLAEPAGDLHRALLAGEVTPREVFSDGSEEPAPTAKEEVERTGAAAQEVVNATIGKAQNVLDAVVNGPADPRVLAEIEHLMLDCRNTWGPKDYADLNRAYAGKYAKTEKGFLDVKALKAGQARDLLADLRTRRGEGDMPDEEPPALTPDDDVSEPFDEAADAAAIEAQFEAHAANIDEELTPDA